LGLGFLRKMHLSATSIKSSMQLEANSADYAVCLISELCITWGRSNESMHVSMGSQLCMDLFDDKENFS